jgi:hypothetical protein
MVVGMEEIAVSATAHSGEPSAPGTSLIPWPEPAPAR